MKTFQFIFLYIFFLQGNILCATNIYTAQDLKILSIQKSYKEFFKHALDIRPSKRGSKWQEIVQSMAVGFLNEKITKEDFNHNDYLLITRVSLWPVLKKNRFYQLKKDIYGASYFQNCFETRPSASFCSNLLYTFWHSSLKQPELALKLAPLLSKYSNKNHDLWIFYQKITNSIISSFHCHKKEVFLATQREVIKHISYETQIQNIKKLTKDLFNTKCIKAMSKAFRNDLYNENEYLRSINYLILKSYKLLSQNEEDLFLTYYILQGPKVGPIFNKAFINLKKLGQDYGRRMSVVSELKRIDPLPGKVFALKNIKKRKIIFNLLSKNIPEYLGYYAQTCIDYLQGEGDFPLGTKTIECSDFFKISKGTVGVTQRLQMKYSTILKPKKSATDK